MLRGECLRIEPVRGFGYGKADEDEFGEECDSAAEPLIPAKAKLLFIFDVGEGKVVLFVETSEVVLFALLEAAFAGGVVVVLVVAAAAAAAASLDVSSEVRIVGCLAVVEIVLCTFELNEISDIEGIRDFSGKGGSL